MFAKYNELYTCFTRSNKLRFESFVLLADISTKAYDDHLKEEAIMGANPAGTDFMSIPDSVQEELPFN